MVANAQPSVPFKGLGKVDGGYGVRKRKKAFVGRAISINALVQQAVLVVQHFAQTRLSHIPAVGFLTVNGI